MKPETPDSTRADSARSESTRTGESGNTRADNAETTHPCKRHKHGDVCGDCGYGIGLQSPDFEGYCD